MKMLRVSALVTAIVIVASSTAYAMTSTLQEQPTPGRFACPQYILAKNLVFPANGATAVPVDVGSIVVGGLSTHGIVTLTPRHGHVVSATKAVTLPGRADQTMSSESAFALPVLRRHKVYRVTVQEPPEGNQPRPCPNNQAVDIGTFST